MMQRGGARYTQPYWEGGSATAMIFAISILTISVLLLIASVLLLAMELNATKRTQRAAISLQLMQQLSSPQLVHALEAMRAISNNGYHPDHEHALLLNDKETALQEIDLYFGYVGDLVRRGMVDEKIFAVMGPSIREAWHTTREPFRHVPTDAPNADPKDDFEWLYLEYLNWDHRNRLVPSGAGK